jgi:hypothetical protein
MTIFSDQYFATTQAVEEAIDTSARQDAIVRIVSERSAADIAEMLIDACEDWMDAGKEVEFSGRTCDGNKWRVHLVRPQAGA